MRFEKIKLEKKEKPQFQNVSSIEIEKAKETENADYQVYVSPKEINEPFEKLKEKVRKQLREENWFLQEYWQEKGLPKEQISVEIKTEDENFKIEIYNWGEILTKDQLKTIEEVLKLFSLIAKGKALRQTKYILIDNIKGKKHPIIGKEMSGEATPSIFDRRIIRLYPKAFENIEHRVKGVSNLEGTLIHELSHKLAPEFVNEWSKKFGKKLKEEKKTPGGSFCEWEGENAVTELAKYDPIEDFCESMVAFFKNPSLLDVKRQKFIKENVLKETTKEKKISLITKKYSGSEITLPKIKSPLKVKFIEEDLEIFSD